MLRTHDIPKEQWASFLQMLSRELTDQPVRLEVENRELGDQEMTRMLPLRDLELETKGSEQGSIALTVGSDRGELGHWIENPSRIFVRGSDAGELDCICIEGQGGDKTLIYFEHPASLVADVSEEEGEFQLQP
jgi:hypothetical protein